MSIVITIILLINLLSLIIIVGYAIGKIQIHNISIGISGILFTAIAIGFLVNSLVPEAHNDTIHYIKNTMKMLSNLGMSLFISVIGLQAGLHTKRNSKGSLIAFIIGVIMSITGVLTMLLISKLDKTISYHVLLGVLCGSLTSTPGLSTVCELWSSNIEEIVWGYGCSYLPSLIITILISKKLSRSANKNNDEQTQKRISLIKLFPELVLICITALFGNALGSMLDPILHVSLGNTAYTLLMGGAVGCVARKKFTSAHLSSQALNTIKKWGLAFFFAGTGFSIGTQSVLFDVRTVIYGALINITAILCGILICKIASLKQRLNTGIIIAGGMTSSPAYGCIEPQTTNESTDMFSLAYLGALTSAVVAIQIVAR